MDEYKHQKYLYYTALILCLIIMIMEDLSWI